MKIYSVIHVQVTVVDSGHLGRYDESETVGNTFYKDKQQAIDVLNDFVLQENKKITDLVFYSPEDEDIYKEVSENYFSKKMFIDCDDESDYVFLQESDLI